MGRGPSSLVGTNTYYRVAECKGEGEDNVEVEVGLSYLRRVLYVTFPVRVTSPDCHGESSLGSGNLFVFEEEPLGVTWAWGEGPLPADRLTG